MAVADLIFAPLPNKPRFVNLNGQRFGQLSVLGYAGEDRAVKQVRYYWWCRCSCGKICKVRSDARNGHTTSCGCAQRKAVTIHGYFSDRKTRAMYLIWKAMMRRCHDKQEWAFKWYGGRGIVVCRRWQHFPAFVSDMGNRPSRNHSMDRIDNNGPYSRENCRWATSKQQGRNKRNNHLLTYAGKTLCVSAWAEITGINATAIYNRKYIGWSDEKTLKTPIP